MGVTAKAMPDGTVVFQVAIQPQQSGSTPQEATPAQCAEVLKASADDPAVIRARGLAVISFVAAVILSFVLFLYSLASVGRFHGSIFGRGGYDSAWAIVAAILAGVLAGATVYHFNWLPHKAVIDLFKLLGSLPDYDEACRLSKWGSLLEVFVGALYYLRWPH
jgi:hypothetical protein